MTVRNPRRLGAAVALALATLTPTVLMVPSTTFAGGPAVTTIKTGASGASVTKVQKALASRGFLKSNEVDGHFGKVTAAALKRFQTSRGLHASGEVDDATSIALGLEESTYFGLERGDSGNDVAALQSALAKAGYSAGSVDGVFGGATEYAVKAFQGSIGYLKTGSMNAATAEALERRVGTTTAKAAIASPAPSAKASAKVGDMRMSIGSRGADVKAIQQILLDLTYDVAGGADGYYGAMTANAMRSFQRDNGLVVDGVVGPNTAGVLAKAKSGGAAKASEKSSSISGLKMGSTGSSVKTLQQRLLDSGVPLAGSVDGIFGPATARAVRLFQSWNGLEQTGGVGPKTEAALASAKKADAGDTTPSGDIGFAVYGESSTRVTALQQALVNAGISLRGGVDGRFGGGTSAAVMAYQKAKGLTVSGKVSEATASKLGLKATSKPKATTPASSGNGYFKVFPVQGWCGFGDTWGAPRGGGRSHIGTDIIAAQGKRIYAVNDGKIEKVYSEATDRLAGNGVRLRLADGTYVFYAHMSQLGPGIGVGVPVKAGQVIGYVGSTGNAYTPHLHIELHPKGGSAVNPYSLLKQINQCTVTDPLPGT